MADQSRTEEKREQEERLKNNLSRIKNTVIVLSGKGGVGKTTFAVNLAYGLSKKNFSVGLLDADIHGPNTAKMLGIEDEKLYSNGKLIEPIRVAANLKVVSMAFLNQDRDQPVIWRGPLKMVVLKQFLSDVAWGDIDYLVVDSPPGTGDEPLSVCQLIKKVDGAIVVTTPQDVAILDSRKSVMFTRQLNVPVLGIVENMSGFVCPHCGKPIDLFGTGGGEKAAEEMGVPFLGRFPIDPELVKMGDKGKPFIQFNKESGSARAMEALVDRIIQAVSDTGKTELHRAE
jgi:ATP-binding protein involved in chromosome partitioning